MCLASGEEMVDYGFGYVVVVVDRVHDIGGCGGQVSLFYFRFRQPEWTEAVVSSNFHSRSFRLSSSGTASINNAFVTSHPLFASSSRDNHTNGLEQRSRNHHHDLLYFEISQAHRVLLFDLDIVVHYWIMMYPTRDL